MAQPLLGTSGGEEGTGDAGVEFSYVKTSMAAAILPTFGGHSERGILTLKGVFHGTQGGHTIQPGIQARGDPVSCDGRELVRELEVLDARGEIARDADGRHLLSQ